MNATLLSSTKEKKYYAPQKVKCLFSNTFHFIHRMVEVVRKLWRWSGPISLLEHSHLPRTTSRQLLYLSKDGNSTTSLDNLCKCLVSCTMRKCFLIFRWNLLCFSCTLYPLSCTKKSLVPASLHPHLNTCWWDYSQTVSSPG